MDLRGLIIIINQAMEVEFFIFGLLTPLTFRWRYELSSQHAPTPLLPIHVENSFLGKMVITRLYQNTDDRLNYVY